MTVIFRCNRQIRVLTMISAMMIGAAVSSTADAQLSITTFGATDAQACFVSAGDDHTTDTQECDAALSGRITLTRRDTAHTHVNRGIILNRASRLSEAIADFNLALAIIPTLAEAYLNRGNSYFLSEQYNQALADYETSLANGLSKAYAAWYNIGLLYDAQNMPDKAREAYENALAANPGYRLAEEKLAKYER